MAPEFKLFDEVGGDRPRGISWEEPHLQTLGRTAVRRLAGRHGAAVHSHRGSKPTPGRRAILAPAAGGLLAALFAMAAAPAFASAPILIGAPTVGDGSWDTQGGVPPTGPIFDYADQFVLTSNQYVSEIDVTVFGVPTSPSFFRFSLVHNLTDTTPLYDAVANSPAQTDTVFSIPIDAVLSAGNYYLRLMTTGFIGWRSSDGDYVTDAGVVANGIWEDSPTSGWLFLPNTSDGFLATPPGVFSVLGADTSTGAAPEPAGWALLVGGFGTLGAALRRSRSARATSQA